ncbi:DUF3604 domain-containing protein [Geminicoccus roseus]|uniref:DUF3604 domain-containing protein n=1 Tax=Geminicoccus roseus TaxID=404900 RepID=UPI000557BC1C|nr:DUF3604 domain-containing protein [Geminicoccus roseus]
MGTTSVGNRVHVAAALLLCLAVPGMAQASHKPPPFERTEQREACRSYQPLRQPLFGETHLHTSFSFDAYVFSVRNDPYAAYAFAKGAPVRLPAASAMGGKPQTRTAQLSRPLDFAAVTDHSELFGEMQVCTRSPAGTPGRSGFECRQMRTGEVVPGKENPDAVVVAWGANPVLRPNGSGPLQPLCSRPGVDCEESAVSVWQTIQDAAEEHYDRSADCTFTTFVAYEYTAQPQYANMHRNVIFRNEKVIASPISNVTTGGPYPNVLWEKLRQNCLEGMPGCDVLTIPHNANVSGGMMFPDPADTKEAKERAFFEPLTEIIQHKGASECRWDRLAGAGVQTTDELCTFEQLLNDTLNTSAPAVPIDEFPTRNFVRNVLKDGLALAPSYEGTNPFKYGLIGSTDSHNGDPGNTVETTFQGHGGTEDAPVAPLIDHVRTGPGGLAVVWAEENSRDSIFAAMRRKEAYGTSGTRPVVRFFGGWDYEVEGRRLCRQRDQVKVAYAKGVPMGSDLPPRTRSKNPRFLVSAMRDPESASLQRIQIIKGWVDAEGETHEKVVGVAGSLTSRPSGVDTRTCKPLPGGFNGLCTIWEDKSFDPKQPAFYYARVLENPTCRWSTMQCKAAGVDPFSSAGTCQRQAKAANAKAVAKGEIESGDTPFDNCCLTEGNDPFIERTIQERAWTSPIWYTPAAATSR